MRRALRLTLAVSLLCAGVALGEEAAGCPLHAKKAQAAEKSALEEVDLLLAEKCGCKGKGDCSCKKGQCQCSACGKKKARMFDSVKGEAHLELPKDARHDATGGVFI